MQSIQRVASLWVSSPLKPCRWTPFPFAPQAGYAKLGALFRAAHVTLGDHVDFVDWRLMSTWRNLWVPGPFFQSPIFRLRDLSGRGVYSAVLYSCLAGWLSTHPLLWLYQQPASGTKTQSTSCLHSHTARRGARLKMLFLVATDGAQRARVRDEFTTRFFGWADFSGGRRSHFQLPWIFRSLIN